MPYIVTIRHDIGPDYDGGSAWVVGTRRAVTTLEEAQRTVRQVVSESLLRQPESTFDYIGTGAWESAEADSYLIAESGGTVGPLPDGTVIEVRAISWSDLRQAVGIKGRKSSQHDPATIARGDRIIDAYNAREAS